MERTLDYYVALPYRIELEEDVETGGYMASIPQLKGCMTCGDDIAKALANLEDAKREWIETAMERGISIPEPDDGLKDYSGQLRLRIPRSLHKRISLRAKTEGVSMNQYCVSLLSEGFGIQSQKSGN